MTALERLAIACDKEFRAWRPQETKPLVFGDGNADRPQIMLIGEAPGEQETLQGRPFVGKAGKNLDEFLQLTGLERAALYVSNVVKLRPTEQGPSGRTRNRPPTKEEIAFFLPWLQREIELVAPQALVTLGNVPLKALLGPQAGVGEKHGQWQETADGYPLFALYHPAAVIYRRALKQVYEQDVLILRDTLTIQTQK